MSSQRHQASYLSAVLRRPGHPVPGSFCPWLVDVDLAEADLMRLIEWTRAAWWTQELAGRSSTSVIFFLTTAANLFLLPCRHLVTKSCLCVQSHDPFFSRLLFRHETQLVSLSVSPPFFMFGCTDYPGRESGRRYLWYELSLVCVSTRWNKHAFTHAHRDSQASPKSKTLIFYHFPFSLKWIFTAFSLKSLTWDSSWLSGSELNFNFEAREREAKTNCT